MLSGKKNAIERRRRRKFKEEDEVVEELDNKENSDSDEYMIEDSPLSASNPAQSVVTDDDGIFTVTVKPTCTITSASTSKKKCKSIFFPSPRIRPGMVVKHNVLYLYGGMVEDGDRQYTLSDFYSLDCRKLEEWETLIADNLSSQIWFDSSSSDSENEDSSNEDDDLSDEPMDIDKK